MLTRYYRQQSGSVTMAAAHFTFNSAVANITSAEKKRPTIPIPINNTTFEFKFNPNYVTEIKIELKQKNFCLYSTNIY